MTSTKFSLVGRQISSRLMKQTRAACIGSFSTKTNRLNDPSTFVQGLTSDDVEKDAALKEYFAVNFPEYGTGSSADTDSASKESSSVKSSALDDEKEEIEYPLNIRPLSAYKRTEVGSQPCYRLREHSQLIPGIIYGSDPTKSILSNVPSTKIIVTTPWELIQREMDLFTYHNFESRVYDLTLYEDDDDDVGEVHRVVPADVQFHPIQHKIYCCNYLRYHPGRPIKIPIVYANEEESAALKRGGFVVPQNRHISCIVEDGAPIPEAVEMDCTGLVLKEVVRMDRLIFPEGVTASKKVNKEKFLVGSIFGRRADEVDEDDADNEEEEKA